MARLPLIVTICAIAWLASAVAAQGSFTTGLVGEAYKSSDPAARALEFDWTREAGAEIARIDVLWRSVAPTAPANAGDPADPAYDFAALDAAVTDATSRGLRVVFTVYRAPEWAEGADPPAGLEGTWKPDAGAFGEFGRALATRYSGQFAGLPAVRFYEAWNEPNLYNFLSPQFKGRRATSPARYVRMLNAFSKGVRSVTARNRVIAGATAPYGDEPGGLRTRPLVFLRKLLCLKPKGAGFRRTRCRHRPQFDILSHHPINLTGGPRDSAIDDDDVTAPDFANVRRTLRAAEKLGTVRGRHPVWVSEIWWETNPPQPGGVGLKKHARWTAESLYVLWRQGAKVVINYIVQDRRAADLSRTVDSGLIAADGTRKPAFSAFRFPFVADRKRGRELFLWGKAPVGGRAKIQRRVGGGWRTIGSTRARAGKVFTKKMSPGGRSLRLRAKIGAEASLPWRLKRR